jgi:RND superfamily putative drug exporter
MRIRGWRKIGAAIVRWPAPVLAASTALTLIGLLALAGALGARSLAAARQ